MCTAILVRAAELALRQRCQIYCDHDDLGYQAGLHEEVSPGPNYSCGMVSMNRMTGTATCDAVSKHDVSKPRHLFAHYQISRRDMYYLAANNVQTLRVGMIVFA